MAVDEPQCTMLAQYKISHNFYEKLYRAVILTKNVDNSGLFLFKSTSFCMEYFLNVVASKLASIFCYEGVNRLLANAGKWSDLLAVEKQKFIYQ